MGRALTMNFRYGGWKIALCQCSYGTRLVAEVHNLAFPRGQVIAIDVSLHSKGGQRVSFTMWTVDTMGEIYGEVRRWNNTKMNTGMKFSIKFPPFLSDSYLVPSWLEKWEELVGSGSDFSFGFPNHRRCQYQLKVVLSSQYLSWTTTFSCSSYFHVLCVPSSPLIPLYCLSERLRS